MFGISAFVFYLLDRISASHAARLDAAAKVPKKEISLDIEYSRHMEITHDGPVFSVTLMLYIAN